MAEAQRIKTAHQEFVDVVKFIMNKPIFKNGALNKINVSEVDDKAKSRWEQMITKGFQLRENPSLFDMWAAWSFVVLMWEAILADCMVSTIALRFGAEWAEYRDEILPISEGGTTHNFMEYYNIALNGLHSLRTQALAWHSKPRRTTLATWADRISGLQSIVAHYNGNDVEDDGSAPMEID